jgi:hypothetical protein
VHDDKLIENAAEMLKGFVLPCILDADDNRAFSISLTRSRMDALVRFAWFQLLCRLSFTASQHLFDSS